MKVNDENSGIRVVSGSGFGSGADPLVGGKDPLIRIRTNYRYQVIGTYTCPRVFQVPPPTLGIRVIGVNMIHGVPDKLNIYVKRVLEGSVAGLDGRIRVNDHIVEVRITLARSIYSLNPDPDFLMNLDLDPDS